MQFPNPYRQFSTGGNNSKSFFMNRKGNVITTQQADNGNFRTFEFKTVTAAKDAMNNPLKIINT